jgi:hypothetical protein
MYTFTVDRSAVEAEVARRRTIHDTGYGRWIAAKLVMSLAAFYAFTFLMRFLPTSRPFGELAIWNLIALLVLPGALAVFVTWMASRTLFSSNALNAESLSAEIAKEMQRLTGPGWPVRTVLAGAALTAAVAVPLVILIVLGAAPAGLASPATPRTIVAFIASIAAWATFMAFLIRSASLFLYRKMVRRATI